MKPAPAWGGLRVWLAAAMLAYVWRVQDLFPALAAVKPVLVATAAVLALAVLDPGVAVRGNALLTRAPAQCALAVGALAIASVPASLYPGLSLTVALKDALPAIALMMVIGASVRAPADAARLAGVQVLGAALYAAVILVRFDVGPDGRLGDLVYYDANDLGMFMACALPLADWLLRNGRHAAARAVAAVAIVLFMLAIVKSGSRGAFLGVIAVVAYGLFAYRSVSVSRRVAVAAALGVVLIAAAGRSYWQSMHTLLDPTSDYNWVGNEEGGRMSVWRRGLGYMAGHPLTGVGIGAFPIAEGTLSPLASRQAYGVGLKWSAAHNSFVQAGAELGVVGLAAFVGMIAAGVAASRRSVAGARRHGDASSAALADALGASLTGYAVSGFFLSQAYAPFLYAQLGLVLGLAALYDRRRAAVTVAPHARRALAAGRPAPALEWGSTHDAR